MSERGVLYMVWGGDDRTERALARSIQSVKDVHPELPVEVRRLKSTTRSKDFCRRRECLSYRLFVKPCFLT